jgi:hypothetical protein
MTNEQQRTNSMRALQDIHAELRNALVRADEHFHRNVHSGPAFAYGFLFGAVDSALTKLSAYIEDGA